MRKEDFIFKLEGNSMNNLKNLLKKLGLSTSGTKMGLLNRVAEFLVTEEGQNQAMAILPS